MNNSASSVYMYSTSKKSFTKIGIVSLPFSPTVVLNTGSFMSYYSNESGNEYIVTIGTEPLSNKQIVSIYDVKNVIVSTGMLNSADTNLYPILFSNKQSMFGSFLIDSVVTKFNLNNFMFLITGNGEIFRCNNYYPLGQINLLPITFTIDIVPCYSITLFDKPLSNNTQGYICQPGYTKQNDGYCYQNKFISVSSGDVNVCGGNNADPICGALFYNGCKAGDNAYKCGTGWFIQTSGDCSSCKVTAQATPVKSDGHIFCDRSNASPKWAKSLDVAPVSQSWGVLNNTNNWNQNACVLNNDESSKWCQGLYTPADFY